MASKVRWGRVKELDKRVRVGTARWEQYPLRLKHLSAWRRIHTVGRGHASVRMYGTRNKVRPSSNLRLKGPVSKVEYLKRKKG